MFRRVHAISRVTSNSKYGRGQRCFRFVASMLNSPPMLSLKTIAGEKDMNRFRRLPSLGGSGLKFSKHWKTSRLTFPIIGTFACLLFQCLETSAAVTQVVVRAEAGNVVSFAAQPAKFVRFVIQASSAGQACLDELEIFGPDGKRNLALASGGAKATASSCLPGQMACDRRASEGVFTGSRGRLRWRCPRCWSRRAARAWRGWRLRGAGIPASSGWRCSVRDIVPSRPR